MWTWKKVMDNAVSAVSFETIEIVFFFLFKTDKIL